MNKTHFELFTLPGHIHYFSGWKTLLHKASGIIFVADSQTKRLEENIESLQHLENYFQEMNLDISTIPFVFQYNKRDLPEILNIASLNEKLNKWNHPSCEAIASQGIGVFETVQQMKVSIRNAVQQGNIKPSINFAKREVSFKIVYYGPGLSGKSTNIKCFYEKSPQSKRGELTSIATEGDRPLKFEIPVLENLIPEAINVSVNSPIPSSTQASLPQSPETSTEPSKPGQTPSSSVQNVNKNQQRSETLHRKMAIRYFKQMNPFICFPLLVIFSEKNLQDVVHQEITQTEAKSDLVVTREKPFVKVVPQIPGCLVVPPYCELDLSPTLTTAHFNVTPLAEGKLERACVEIYYEQKKVESIPIETRVEKQTLAKMIFCLSILSPIFSTLLDLLQIDLKQNLPLVIIWLQKLAQVFGGSFSGFGILFAFVLFCFALLFYQLKRPQEASPLEKMFSLRTRS